MSLTAKRAREVLDYDPFTGSFQWKIPRRGIRLSDTPGWVDNLGYRHIRVDRVLYLAHRLAWLHYYGRWPKSGIDHKNLIPGDDRIKNLRESTQAQNMANVGLSRANKSGFKGVSVRRGKWRATITINRQQIYLGDFSTPKEAHTAYSLAAKQFHGEFFRTR